MTDRSQFLADLGKESRGFRQVCGGEPIAEHVGTEDEHILSLNFYGESHLRGSAERLNVEHHFNLRVLDERIGRRRRWDKFFRIDRIGGEEMRFPGGLQMRRRGAQGQARSEAEK